MQFWYVYAELYSFLAHEFTKGEEAAYGYICVPQPSNNFVDGKFQPQSNKKLKQPRIMDEEWWWLREMASRGYIVQVMGSDG